jgi:hypothetical protein
MLLCNTIRDLTRRVKLLRLVKERRLTAIQVTNELLNHIPNLSPASLGYAVGAIADLVVQMHRVNYSAQGSDVNVQGETADAKSRGGSETKAADDSDDEDDTESVPFQLDAMFSSTKSSASLSSPLHPFIALLNERPEAWHELFNHFSRHLFGGENLEEIFGSSRTASSKLEGTSQGQQEDSDGDEFEESEEDEQLRIVVQAFAPWISHVLLNPSSTPPSSIAATAQTQRQPLSYMTLSGPKSTDAASPTAATSGVSSSSSFFVPQLTAAAPLKAFIHTTLIRAALEAGPFLRLDVIKFLLSFLPFYTETGGAYDGAFVLTVLQEIIDLLEDSLMNDYDDTEEEGEGSASAGAQEGMTHHCSEPIFTASPI